MSTSYTSLLGLALPVTGELSGTWGAMVDNAITSPLDIAVAGTQSITGDSNVTLSVTNGDTVGTNLAQVGSGSTGSAQYAIILCSGARTALRTITAPAASKIYTVINATTGGFSVKIVGAGPTTGLTIPNGSSAVIAWNGSDFIEIGSSTVGNFTVNGNLTVTGTSTLTGAVTNTAGTANGVAYLNGSKVLTTGTALVFDGTNLGVGTSSPAVKLETSTTSAGATVEVLRLSNPGSGANTQAQLKFFTTATNYATISGGYGASAPQMTFDLPNATAGNYVWQITTSEQMRLTSTGLGIGATSLFTPLTVTNGGFARAESGSNSTGAFIQSVSNDRTTTTPYTLAGSDLRFTTGAAGSQSEKMRLDSAGNFGLGVTPSAWGSGEKAIQVNNQGAFWSINSSNPNVWVSANTYFDNTNVRYINTAVATAYQQTNGQHVFYNAPSGTAGNAITFTQAMTLDADGNLAVGTSTASGKITAVVPNNASYQAAGVFSNATNADFIVNLKTNSTQIGPSTATPLAFAIGNSEVGRFDSSGNLLVGQTTHGFTNTNSFEVSPPNGGYTIGNHASGSASGSPYAYFAYNGSAIGSITQSGTTAVLYNVTSDQRLKKNIVDAAPASDLIDSLQVRQFDWKTDNTHQRYGFVAQELVNVAPEAVHQPADPEEMMAVDYSKLVPMLVKEIQDLRKRLAAAGI